MQKQTTRKNSGTVYLLHFNTPYKHAKHYTGFTKDLDARLEQHTNGQGARLMEVVTDAGISFQVARTWKGTRNTERQIKNQKNAPKLCPICQEAKGRN